METLSKEWQKEAEKNAEETTPTTGSQTAYQTAINAAQYDYLQGATAYKQAVEKMITDDLNYLRGLHFENTDKEYCKFNEELRFHIETVFLSQLTTLKPTSND
jgi:hypothetical protein